MTLLCSVQSCHIPRTVNTLEKIRFRAKPNVDQTRELEHVLATYNNVEIEFESGQTFIIGGVFDRKNRNISFLGTDVIIQTPDDYKGNSSFTFVDPKNLEIRGLTFDGNYRNSETAGHLLQVHVTGRKVGAIRIEDCIFMDADYGCIRIRNMGEFAAVKNVDSGAQEIHVRNCIFANPGTNSALNIRGSHLNSLVQNCVGIDSLNRLHYSQGSMFGASADVISDDWVGKLTFDNCVVRDSPKGFFAQKVRDLRIINCTVLEMGKRQSYYPDGRALGIVGLKIDDLGSEGRAIINGFTQLNSGSHEYKIAIALEQTEGIGSTQDVTILNCRVDSDIRIAGLGKNVVKNTVLLGSKISLLSPGNRVENCLFDNYVGVAIFKSNNSIANCRFKNSGINIYRDAQFTQIKECSMQDCRERQNFILVDSGQDNNLELEITDCFTDKDCIGVKAGGLPKASSNIKIDLDMKRQAFFRIHEYILNNGEISLKKNKVTR